MLKFIFLLVGIAAIWAGITWNNDKETYPTLSKWAVASIALGGALIGLFFFQLTKRGIEGGEGWKSTPTALGKLFGVKAHG